MPATVPFRLAAMLLAALLAAPATGATGDSAGLPEPGQSARDRYARLLAEDRNEEAAAVAAELVALTRELRGPDSVELAGPLTDLATAQLRSGALPDALANFQGSIALLEKHQGILTPGLVPPLAGLGEAFIRGGDYPRATQAFERALRVNHVNEGFYNLEQIPIRDGLTEGFLGQRDLDKANFHQEAQIYVQQRKLGRDNPELVGPLTKLGSWYQRTGQSEAARFAYQNASRLIERTGSKDDPALVDPLLAIAETYRQQALLPPDPESNQSPETLLPLSSMMLRKALEITSLQQPPDQARRARILVELGDLYLMWGKRATATERYQEAWQALSSSPDLLVQRDETFAQPARIMGPVPPAILPVPARNAPLPTDLAPGFVVVRFNVDEAGRVSGATIVEAEPANLLETRVAEAARNTLFRPRYVNGAPVAASGLIMRHEFRFAPRRLEREDKPPDAGKDDRPLPQPLSGPGA